MEENDIFSVLFDDTDSLPLPTLGPAVSNSEHFSERRS